MIFNYYALFTHLKAINITAISDRKFRKLTDLIFIDCAINLK